MSSLLIQKIHQTGCTPLSSVEAHTSETQGRLAHLHCCLRRALPRYNSHCTGCGDCSPDLTPL